MDGCCDVVSGGETNRNFLTRLNSLKWNVERFTRKRIQIQYSYVIKRIEKHVANADGRYWHLMHKKKSIKEISIPLVDNRPQKVASDIDSTAVTLPCAIPVDAFNVCISTKYCV